VTVEPVCAARVVVVCSSATISETSSGYPGYNAILPYGLS
jgi:hypothetical protein